MAGSRAATTAHLIVQGLQHQRVCEVLAGLIEIVPQQALFRFMAQLRTRPRAGVRTDGLHIPEAGRPRGRTLYTPL